MQEQTKSEREAFLNTLHRELIASLGNAKLLTDAQRDRCLAALERDLANTPSAQAGDCDGGATRTMLSATI